MRLDRRRNLNLVTRNTEYHVHLRECVGVKDLRTGQWLSEHPALRTWLAGGMDRRSKLFDRVLVGARLVFTDGHRDVVTSPLVGVTRPEKLSPEKYTWRSQSGLIELAA